MQQSRRVVPSRRSFCSGGRATPARAWRSGGGDRLTKRCTAPGRTMPEETAHAHTEPLAETGDSALAQGAPPPHVVHRAGEPQ
jgi:hypothetical protein